MNHHQSLSSHELFRLSKITISSSTNIFSSLPKYASRSTLLCFRYWNYCSPTSSWAYCTLLVWIFFHQGKPPRKQQSRTRKLKTCLGTITIKQNRAESLGIKKYQRISPLLEKCSLLICANNSYFRAEEDLEVLTGIKIAHSSLHRQVNQTTLAESISEQATD